MVTIFYFIRINPQAVKSNRLFQILGKNVNLVKNPELLFSGIFK